MATNSPFNPEQIVIVGLKDPVMGILIASIIPDPTYPEAGTKPFGVIFPPNEITGRKSLITFDGIRRAFGLSIEQIFLKLTNRSN